MDRHVTLLGVLYIAFGILGVVIGLFLFWLLAIPGIVSGEAKAFAVLTTLGGLIGGVIAVTSVPDIIAGYGLLKRREWARIMALILAAISLFEIPIGTAVGVYAFWVLLQEGTVKLFKPSPAQA